MDSASLIGILLGITAVVGGNLAEGGKLDSIVQPTAALIVFGGTLGATLLSFPARDIIKAVFSLRDVFSVTASDQNAYIDELVRYASLVRKNGLITLEREMPRLNDHFLKKTLGLAIDRMGARVLKDTMYQEITTYEEERRRIARVFETAGGFAPTVGIIGAVLGLIHVMENLAEPAKLGSGIAVAFVATIYGVGSANLILLPISKKLQNHLSHEVAVKEMIVEGVIGIQNGVNPHYLRERLKVFVEEKVADRQGRRRGI